MQHFSMDCDFEDNN